MKRLTAAIENVNFDHYFFSNKEAAVQRLPDSLPDVICSFDTNGRFVHLSASSKQLWGYYPNELVGKTFMDLVVAEDHPKTIEIAKMIMSGVDYTTFENHYIRKDGSVIPVLWSASWCPEEQTIHCVAKDAAKVIKEKRQQEFQERRLQRAYKLAGLAWWEYDIATQTYTSSDEVFEMYGLPLSPNKQTKLQEFLALVHPDDAAKLFSDLSNLCKDTYINYEHRVVKPSGEIIHIVHYAEIIRDGLGKPIALHGTAKNITEDKKKEAALKLANERYELAAKATSEALWDWDIKTNNCYFNKGFTTQFGFDNAADRIYNNWVENIHDNDKARIFRSVEKALKDQSVSQWQGEYRFYRKDGTIADVLDSGFIIRDEKGNAIRMVGAMQDISKQKETQRTIKLSEEKFKLLFYQCPKPKWMFDAQSLQMREVNKAALELYGYTEEEFLQLTVLDLKTKKDHPILLNLTKKALTKYQNVVQHVKKNGEVFSIEISAHPIQLPSGDHYIVTGDDLTEKIELQKKVVEEKLAAEKEISKAVISTQENERSMIGKELHDNVCQLLTTAKLYIENLKHFPDLTGEFADKGIALLMKSITEIRCLSKQLVPPAMSELGFEASVNELISHYEILGLFEIKLAYALHDEAIEKDFKLTIYRILQELLNNIVKYAKATEVCITIVGANGKINLYVEDDGVGFDLNKASSGLGLNNIRNRAEVYQGKVMITSSEGKGCQTLVSFPVPNCN